jgi:hypothetical protein
MYPAFIIKERIGGAAWSSVDQRGGFIAPTGNEVVLNTPVALALQADVGTEVFTLLLNLAMLATRDDDDRLVVEGGAERIGMMVGWGREKSFRIFNEAAEVGFVMREQDKGFAKDGKPRYGRTRIVLAPTLYQPAADITDSGRGSGSAVGFSDGGRSDSAHTDSGPVRGISDSGVSDGGKPDPARVGPDGAGRGISDGGDAAGMLSVDADLSATTINTPAARDTAAEKARLRERHLRALAAINFIGAADAVAETDPALLEACLRYTLERIHELTNPPGFLKELLRAGGPPATANSAAELRSILDNLHDAPPQPDQPKPTMIVHQAAEIPVEDDLIDLEALAVRLARLPREVRAEFEHEADQKLYALPAYIRNHMPDSGEAQVRAAKLLDLVDDYDQQFPPGRGDGSAV